MNLKDSDENITRMFHFASDDIIIPYDDLIRKLGYDKNNIPHPVLEAVNGSIESALKYSSPVGGFTILKNHKIKILSDHFLIDDICIDDGSIINRYFKNAESVAIIVSSIGKDPESIANKLIQSGEHLNGYVLDLLCSAMVEKTCDLTENELNKYLKQSGDSATNRYSPGYCGWDVKDQHKLFSFLPINFCGIRLTESAMMDPVKSISAIIGIGKNVSKEEYECKICEFDYCYRKEKPGIK